METKKRNTSLGNWKRNRSFSEGIKKKCVRDIEQNLSTVIEISREYEVSPSAVYNWIYQYSSHLKKGVTSIRNFFQHRDLIFMLN